MRDVADDFRRLSQAIAMGEESFPPFLITILKYCLKSDKKPEPAYKEYRATAIENLIILAPSEEKIKKGLRIISENYSREYDAIQPLAKEIYNKIQLEEAEENELNQKKTSQKIKKNRQIDVPGYRGLPEGTSASQFHNTTGSPFASYQAPDLKKVNNIPTPTTDESNNNRIVLNTI